MGQRPRDPSGRKGDIAKDFHFGPGNWKEVSCGFPCLSLDILDLWNLEDWALPPQSKERNRDVLCTCTSVLGECMSLCQFVYACL